KVATATEDHIFYILNTDDGLIKETEISKLNVGDYLIVSNKSKVGESKDIREIDLINNLKDVYVSTENIIDLLTTEEVLNHFGKFKNGENKVTSSIRYGKISLVDFIDGPLSKYKEEIFARNNTYY